MSVAASLVLLAACAHVPTEQELALAENHHDQAVLALRENNAQVALSEMQEAVRLNPDLASGWNTLGLIYQFSYGRLADAEASFVKALEVKPKFSEAKNNLGALLADRGQLEKAKLLFEDALHDPLYPTPYIAQVNLGWVLHQLGQSGNGEALMRSALGTHPDFCLGHRQLARLLEATGRQADADASWLRFRKFCPTEPEALLRGGGAQLRAGEFAKARKSWMKCLELAADKPVATDCRAALSSLPATDDAPVTDEPEPAPDENAGVRVLDPVVTTETIIEPPAPAPPPAPAAPSPR